MSSIVDSVIQKNSDPSKPKSRRLLGMGKRPAEKIEDLSVKQKIFAELLANVSDSERYSDTKYANKLGVTPHTIYKWRKLSTVQELALQIYRNKNHIKHAIDIHEAVAARAKRKGGAADARLYFEHQDRIMGIDYHNKFGNTFNVDNMIMIVREENKKNKNNDSK